uniref:Uncharacterized protein n=1 Tax=Setaria italica TaxID=4555 RepID=K4A432_SETIT
MASSAALRTAAVLMLVLFAGQLLVATPAAAAARRSLLQVPNTTVPCGDNNICRVTCLEICVRRCNGFLDNKTLLLACQKRQDCVGECKVN